MTFWSSCAIELTEGKGDALLAVMTDPHCPGEIKSLLHNGRQGRLCPEPTGILWADFEYLQAQKQTSMENCNNQNSKVFECQILHRNESLDCSTRQKIMTSLVQGRGQEKCEMNTEEKSQKCQFQPCDQLYI